MKNRIIERYAEISRLDHCMDSSSAQLVVYGRRRVRKTFLINEYFDNDFAFQITGAYKKIEEIPTRKFQWGTDA